MNIEEEIEKIKQRNKKVETDKAWETSPIRKICICILTYIVVVIYTYITKKESNIFLSSLVPVMGFALSTLSLGGIRKVWEKKWIKNTKSNIKIQNSNESDYKN